MDSGMRLDQIVRDLDFDACFACRSPLVEVAGLHPVIGRIERRPGIDVRTWCADERCTAQDIWAGMAVELVRGLVPNVALGLALTGFPARSDCSSRRRKVGVPWVILLTVPVRGRRRTLCDTGDVGEKRREIAGIACYIMARRDQDVLPVRLVGSP